MRSFQSHKKIAILRFAEGDCGGLFQLLAVVGDGEREREWSSLRLLLHYGEEEEVWGRHGSFWGDVPLRGIQLYQSFIKKKPSSFRMILFRAETETSNPSKDEQNKRKTP